MGCGLGLARTAGGQDGRNNTATGRGEWGREEGIPCLPLFIFPDKNACIRIRDT